MNASVSLIVLTLYWSFITLLRKSLSNYQKSSFNGEIMLILTVFGIPMYGILVGSESREILSDRFISEV